MSENPELASVTFLEDIREGATVREATTHAPVDADGWIVGLDSDDGSLGPPQVATVDRDTDTWSWGARPVEDRDDDLWDWPPPPPDTDDDVDTY